ncbi:MAG: SRPBCC family protein [Acidimicrobiia bacterium]|nr:SRPBCC family protein [Acidimicrobiia bacterium]
MTTVTRRSTTTIAADPDTIWKELDVNFLEISNWAGGVKSSVAHPATPEGVNGSAHGGRLCDVEGVGMTDERIIGFDADTRTLTYVVRAEGLPFFVDRLENTWTVRPDGPNGAAVDVEMTGITKGPVGRVGAFPLGRLLAKAAAGLPDDLRRHIEHQA